VTRDDLAGRVRTTLDDSGVTFFSADDINDSVQDAYDEYISLVRPLEGVATINFLANTTFYNLESSITDLLSVMAIYNTNTKKWMDFKGIQFYQEWNYEWQKQSGEPRWFTILDVRWSAIVPRLNTATGGMDIVYKKRAPTLLAATELTTVEDQTLEWYCLADLLAQAEEYQKSLIYYQDYISSIRRSMRFVRDREHPDRIPMLREQFLGASIFD
jgi:hypothetical protein